MAAHVDDGPDVHLTDEWPRSRVAMPPAANDAFASREARSATAEVAVVKPETDSPAIRQTQSACIARRSTSRPSLPDSALASRESTTHLDRQLQALRSRLHRSGAKPATPRQPLRARGVTHVLGTFCYPSVRAGHRSNLVSAAGARTLDPLIKSQLLWRNNRE